jgi:hypothetical protein
MGRPDAHVLSAGASFIGAWFDRGDAQKNRNKGYILLYALYVIKSSSGVASGGLTLAVTFTYAGPLVARLTGRAAVGVTIEAVGARAAAIIGLRILGMAIGGWITVGTVALQVVIWTVTPDALEEWVDHCAFGNTKGKGSYKTVKEQEERLAEALVAMGLQ